MPPDLTSSALELERSGVETRVGEMRREGDRTLGARRELFGAHRDRLLARMAELEEDLKVLNYKIDAYGREDRER